MKYTVITDNGGGPNLIYHDIAGEVYTFPTRYRDLLLPGTKVVYHRSKKSADSPEIKGRMSDESHYFAVAEIGEVTPTEDGNLRATIINYELFKYPVYIHKDKDTYYEINPFWQQGVRATTETVYNEILEASKTKPVEPEHTPRAKSTGVRSKKTLGVGEESKPFCKVNGEYKFQVVTSKDGYYLKHLPDEIYYELALVNKFKYKESQLRVLAKQLVVGEVKSISYAIFDDNATPPYLGILEPIPNGVKFTGKVDFKDVEVYIKL